MDGRGGRGGCRREGLQLLWVSLLPQILFPLSAGLFPFRGCAHSNIGKRGLFTPFRLDPMQGGTWALKPGFQLSPSLEFWSQGFQLELWNHLNWILFRFSFHILCKVLWHQKAPPNQSLSSGVWWSNIFIHFQSFLMILNLPKSLRLVCFNICHLGFC